MRPSIRTAAVALVGLAAATVVPAATGSAPASAAVAASVPSAPGCAPRATTLHGGTTVSEQVFSPFDVSAAPYAVHLTTLPGAVTAMAGASSQLDEATYPPRHRYTRQFTVRDGELRFGTTTLDRNEQTRTHVEKSLGGGWAAATRLADASDREVERTKSGYLYAVSSRTGNLARFKVTEQTWGSPTVTPAGSAKGFGAVRAMTLAYQYKVWDPSGQDALLMTTERGALYLVTMGRGKAFVPRLTLLRGATWTFDGLALNNCGPDSWILVAADSARDEARVYEVFRYRGEQTRIKALGRVSGSWTAERTAAYWESDVPRLDP